LTTVFTIQVIFLHLFRTIGHALTCFCYISPWSLIYFVYFCPMFKNSYLKTTWLNGTNTLYNSYVNVVQITQLAHYVFTTFQFGCSLVRFISYVNILLSQRISEYPTWGPPFFKMFISSLLWDVFIINSVEQLHRLEEGFVILEMGLYRSRIEFFGNVWSWSTLFIMKTSHKSDE
jgi:hypothetical protein